jgi:hypothetical protein
MEEREAKKVIKGLFQADGRCGYCARRWCLLFCESFPEFTDLTKKMYKKEFKEDLGEE